MKLRIVVGCVLLSFLYLCGCAASVQTGVPVSTVTQTNLQTQDPVNTPKSTEEPTQAPIQVPTQTPIQEPTQAPTKESTEAPTQVSTPTPTQARTTVPQTPKKTPTPTKTPTPKPTIQRPEGSLEGLVIGIDPGHQGKGNSEQEPIGPGATTTRKKVSSGTQGKWSRVPEYEVVLEVGLQLKALLEEAGATVIMSRETHNVNISNAERAKMMNEAGADLVIRIHCNGNDNTSVYGACMLVPSGNYNPEIHAVSKEAGEVILNRFIEVTEAKNNGVIKRSDLSGFNWSTVPVCLIEMGYMSNKQEDTLLTSAEYQKKCAQGLFEGILRYFN